MNKNSIRSTLVAAVALSIVTSFLFYRQQNIASTGIEENLALPIDPRASDLQGTKLQKHTFSQMQMAMEMRITVWCESEERAQSACKLAFERAAMLVKVFSDYDETSEIKSLERSQPGVPVKISDPLLKVITFSRDLHNNSHGAFDPTIGPVVQLWRTARKRRKLPNSELIKSTLDERTGFDKLTIAEENKTVTLLAKGIAFDFGGIAKGFIGDEVLSVLRDNGIEIACYQAGGDFVLGDPPPHSKGWPIDVGVDENDERKIVYLSNCGASTSGDSQQFVILDGKTYSHVVDPRSGMALTSRRTAFAIAPTGMASDAIATTGSVLAEPQFDELLQFYEKTKGWSKTAGN